MNTHCGAGFPACSLRGAGWNACTTTRRRGAGLVELMIALSISASLLAAVGVAVDASFRGYRFNQEQAILMQRTRVAQHQITTTIRTTKQHSPVSAAAKTTFSTGGVVTDTGIEMFDLNDRLVRYELDVPTKRLLVTTNGKTYTLASGVEKFQVRMEPMRSAASVRTGGGWDLLKRATITMTVRTTGDTAASGESTGLQTLTLSSSAMPRRNVW